MGADILNDFNFSGVDPSKTVVRCATQEEADIFLEYLGEKGVWDWTSVDSVANQWSKYGNSTCYHISKNNWCYDRWYREMSPELFIIDFCEVYKPKKSEPKISFEEAMYGVVL